MRVRRGGGCECHEMRDARITDSMTVTSLYVLCSLLLISPFITYPSYLGLLCV